MRATLCVLLAAACVIADKNTNRRTKPFVADAVGNTLPPPSSLPATVGSPVNLLTPDRYEFYTFDESGELVKRLMTLQEIQAIVAAGEDSDGLVTFANDNQPTIAFNFSQPPFTKVHNVVTNVQNVLKAQMEAHKNSPQMRPTLDTPDVSDSWSLILPSIFGNAGVDISPEKTESNFTPETDTMDVDKYNEINLLSKEGESPIVSTTAAEEVKTTKAPVTTPTTSTTTTTTPPSTTTTTTKKPTTTEKPRTTTKIISTTRAKPPSKPTTPKPVRFSQKTTTTAKPTTTTKKASSTTTAAPTEKPAEFEKISTFIPVSTVKYVTERTTKKPVLTTKSTVTSSTKNAPSTTAKPQTTTTVQPKTTEAPITKATTEALPQTTVKDEEIEKVNATTLTTQSVSPSTASSSTENISSDQKRPEITNVVRDPNPVFPTFDMFDVAQSISQIASDLGSNYQPIPTASDLLDTTKITDMESKENTDMDIPSAGDDRSNNNVTEKLEDNFIKISTIDPHAQQDHKKPEEDQKVTEIPEAKTTTEAHTTENVELYTTTSENNAEITTRDPLLYLPEGLLNQVIQSPVSIIPSEGFNKDLENNAVLTTESSFETTTNIVETTSNTPTTISSTAVPFKRDVTTNKIISTPEQKTTTEKITLDDKPPVDKVNKLNNVDENKIEVKDKVENNAIKNNNDVVNVPITNNNSPNEELATKVTDLKEIKVTTETTQTTEAVTTSTTTTPTTLTSNKIKDEEITKKPEVSTTLAPKVEITTKQPNNINDKISQSNINKINSADKTTNKLDKDTVPKIDEFKKKIQKVNIAEEELINERNNSWKLIPTVTPPKGDLSKDKNNESPNPYTEITDNKDLVLEYFKENQGLEVTTKDLSDDIAQFTELCNELAFRYWHVMVENIDKKRSFVLSPYSITSMLAMMFMGARGSTSGEMNDILKLDDMVTFNPHFTLKNISDSIETTPESGIIVSAFIRELYSDRNKGKILTFYKERAQHFYSGHVEEINFKLISDIIRRRTNLLVKRYTWGKIPEYMKTNSISLRPPLAAFSANIYHTDCTGSSVEGRDGEMYFVVSPNIRQRRLVPVPAVVYKSGFLAGYDPVLDATVAALGNTNSIVSTIFLMPGQQGNIVHSDDLEKLEQRLLEANPSKMVWTRVLRTLLPRVGLELQIPRFSHKSVFNVSSTLREMGLKDLFDADHADLAGLNGPSKDLYLSDMVQMTSFVTCGEGMVGDQHHVEEYPEASGLSRRRTVRWVNDWDEPRDYQRAFHDPHDVGEAMHLPLHLRPRQARVPSRSAQPARLKFDRPFLYFVRHNFSGMILYVGRYNPRLLP